jgi:hypothetical protein
MDWIIPELRQHAVELDKLKLDPANANTHPEKNLRAIMDSLSAFGQRQVVLARKGTGVVIAGNGRLMAARALGWSHIAAVYVDDDDITAVRYAIADNRTSELSEWDKDVLGMLLQTINDDFGSLEGTGFAAGDLDALLAEVGGGEKQFTEDPSGSPGVEYTQKIKIPIYAPSDKKPAVQDLFDKTKSDLLISRIEGFSLPPDVSEFLKCAATRHISFNFQRIADFYAHSSPEIQDLFEQSALVIVDYDKAIELGFVKLTNRLAELAGVEAANDKG